MLTSQEALAEYDFDKGLILPDRLTRPAHSHYLPVASQLLQIYADSIGTTRQRVHQRAQEALEQLPDCSSRRMAGLIKLLDDVSQYQPDRGRKAAKLRQQVFGMAASKHPLVTNPDGLFTSEHREVKRQIALELGLPWKTIQHRLYSDVIDFHPLVGFTGFESAEALLARYNVAQVQAALYRATRMTLWAASDLKTITRIIKLSRLMHMVRRLENGEFQFNLSGPASALRGTRRYGVAMAKMIPTLLACKDWRLTATVELSRGKRKLQLQLTCNDGLTSTKQPSDEFDSEVEADLMRKWNASPVAGWMLEREKELLVRHQKIFMPDFLLTHSSGKRVHLEVIGYWTPEYIQAKLKTLQEFADEPIWIIAQHERLTDLGNLPDSMRQSILLYKTRISLKELARRLNGFEQSNDFGQENSVPF